jgi:FixJ family two-component response regulator
VVCIVDDDPSLRRAVGNLLRSVGMRVESFESSEAYRQQPQPVRGRCLILDIQLPGMDGIDLLTELAASGSAVPAVILTAVGGDDVRRRALAAGAVAFLTKPFRADALLEAVRAALAQAA